MYFKATPQFLQTILSKVGMMVAYDDMDSISKEEGLGVLAFDGGNIGTKQDGLQKLVN